MNTEEQAKLLKMVHSMKSDRVRNYVLAGLDSYLLNNGTVRLFSSERETHDHITPHSHRFDFLCIVLSGYVVNRLWKLRPAHSDDADSFMRSKLYYNGEIGKHSREEIGGAWYSYADTTFRAGQCYAMASNEIHSIKFSRDANVLFFEGPSKSLETTIIEPIVDGKVIRTYETKPYMFLKGDA